MLKDQAGHTLIELIMAIVILGFALLGLVGLFFNLSVNDTYQKYRTTAGVLSAGLMEEIKSKKFDERLQRDVSNNWSVLGVDSGETSGTKSTYDDVDDFNGWSETLSAPYGGYSRQVTVGFVDPSNLDAVVNDRTQSYKKVTVTVNQNGVAYSTLNTIIAPTREEIS